MSTAKQVFVASIVCATLAACQTTAPQSADGSGQTAEAGGSQAYRAHRVEDSVKFFRDVCMQPNLTVAHAENTARQLGFGLTAPTQVRFGGTPSARVSARAGGVAIEDRNQVFEELNCSVEFRGTWADTVFPQVRSDLASRGFRIVSGPNREGGPAFGGGNGVGYTAVATRNGTRFNIQVSHADGGQRMGSTQFISGTRLLISNF